MSDQVTFSYTGSQKEKLQRAVEGLKNGNYLRDSIISRLDDDIAHVTIGTGQTSKHGAGAQSYRVGDTVNITIDPNKTTYHRETIYGSTSDDEDIVIDRQITLNEAIVHELGHHTKEIKEFRQDVQGALNPYPEERYVIDFVNEYRRSVGLPKRTDMQEGAIPGSNLQS